MAWEPLHYTTTVRAKGLITVKATAYKLSYRYILIYRNITCR